LVGVSLTEGYLVGVALLGDLVGVALIE
jgi:hypothetical protein